MSSQRSDGDQMSSDDSVKDKISSDESVKNGNITESEDDSKDKIIGGKKYGKSIVIFYI